MSHMDLLRQASANLNTVNITYKKKIKGKSVTSEVKDYKSMEVYKIVGDKVWLYDTKADQIKQFIVREDTPTEGILYVSVNEGEVFEPRFEDKDKEEEKPAVEEDNTYEVKFIGRPVGAGGLCRSIETTVQASSAEDAETKLYTCYEDIKDLRIKLQEKEKASV